MEKRIEDLRVKESNLWKSYTDKVFASIKNRKYTERSHADFTIMVADQFGLEEHIYSLCNNTDKKSQKYFVNNLEELNYSNDEIESLLAMDKELLPKKYGIEQHPEPIQKAFYKHHERFLKVLKEFVDKRNVYRKTDSEKMLEELVMLKAHVIQHLCVMEKLVNKKN
jgi:Pkip-1 protein